MLDGAAFNAAICAVAFCVGLPWGPIGVAAAYSISQVLLRSPVVCGWRREPAPVRLRDLCGIATMHALAERRIIYVGSLSRAVRSR